MENFIIASFICLGLLLTSVIFFYEILAHVWAFLPKLEGRPRVQILLTVLASFLGHTVTVWLFGLTYYILASQFDFGNLKGEIDHEMIDYVYFSSVAYSSLGLGDVYPTGGLQLLVGVEAILGLLLIGWTVTFTYLVTEKYLTHRRNRHHTTHGHPSHHNTLAQHHQSHDGA